MNNDDEEDYAVLYDDIGYALVLWNVKISDKVLPDAKPVSFSYLSRLLPGDYLELHLSLEAEDLPTHKTNVYFAEKELCSEKRVNDVLDWYEEHSDEYEHRGYVLRNTTLYVEDKEDEGDE